MRWHSTEQASEWASKHKQQAVHDPHKLYALCMKRVRCWVKSANIRNTIRWSHIFAHALAVSFLLLLWLLLISFGRLYKNKFKCVCVCVHCNNKRQHTFANSVRAERKYAWKGERDERTKRVKCDNIWRRWRRRWWRRRRYFVYMRPSDRLTIHSIHSIKRIFNSNSFSHLSMFLCVRIWLNWLLKCGLHFWSNTWDRIEQHLKYAINVWSVVWITKLLTNISVFAKTKRK